MNVLVYIALRRYIPSVVSSIAHLEYERPFQIVWGRGDDTPPGDTSIDACWDAVTRKMETGRQMALRGGYDALLCIDDDQIVPPNTITRLVGHLRAGAGVAYGLTVQRLMPRQWSAILDAPSTGDEQRFMTTLDQRPDVIHAVWGGPVDVVGCGMYCTAISRAVLELGPFHRRGMHCCDWYFAQDCQRAGVRQVCDTGVVAGHVRWELPPPVVYWPDPGQPSGYREEAL